MTIDVSALYTNIPHVEGIRAAQTFLQQRRDPTPPTHIVLRLIHLILTKNAFMFNGRYFHQIKGTAMGTKMAPTYANLFMGQLEEQLLKNSPIQPRVWKRYIDDIFCIIPNGAQNTESFLSYLNNQHDSIKFTSEASPRSINYLDVTVYTDINNKLCTHFILNQPMPTSTSITKATTHPTKNPPFPTAN